jgi:hypothetical protein
MSLDRIRQLLGLVDEFGAGNIEQIVLLPPFTSEATIAGQDVILPNWNLILPAVHQRFP